MNESTSFTILVIALPFFAAIGAYMLLRRGSRPVVVSSCAAIALGVLISFAITLLFYLAGRP
ncbi:MAG TPA: hypothetical protein VMM78_04175 [Thermomicrobiales bacterium]|nr:hypothetical protein [Thermomicrobiales bacterium]